MINAHFLAIMQEKPIDPVLFTERIKQMCRFFHCDEDHGWEVHIVCACNVALAYISKIGDNLNTPLCYEDESGLYIGMQVPIGVPSYFPKDDMFSGKYLKDIWNILPKNHKMAQSICPPQAFIGLFKEQNTLKMFTDWLGICRVYEQVHPHMHAWTNFAPMLPFVTGVPLHSDPEGWACNAGWRTFVKGTTPYLDTQELRHGAFHFAIGKQQEIHVIPYVSETFDLKTNCTPSPADYQRVSGSINSFIEDISFCVNGPLLVDLSGGRDSRVAVAHAIATGIDFTVNTIGRPELDANIATSLMAAVGLQNKHNVTYHDETDREPLYPKGKDIAEHNRIFLLSNFCGTLSGFVDFDLDTMLRPDTIIKKHLSGTTGELVQANAYQMHDYKDPQGVMRRLEGLIYGIGTNIFCSEYTKNICSERMTEYINKALTSNLSGFYICDYVYAFNVLARYFVLDNTLEGRASYVYLYDYVQTGFAPPIPQKIKTSFMRKLTEQVVPQWKGIPYFHEIAKPENSAYFNYTFFWEDEQALACVRDIISGNAEYERWYNIDTILNIAKDKPSITYNNVTTLIFCNQITMRLCIHVAHDLLLQEINSQICQYNE